MDYLNDLAVLIKYSEKHTKRQFDRVNRLVTSFLKAYPELSLNDVKLDEAHYMSAADAKNYMTRKYNFGNDAGKLDYYDHYLRDNFNDSEIIAVAYQPLNTSFTYEPRPCGSAMDNDTAGWKFHTLNLLEFVQRVDQKSARYDSSSNRSLFLVSILAQAIYSNRPISALLYGEKPSEFYYNHWSKFHLISEIDRLDADVYQHIDQWNRQHPGEARYHPQLSLNFERVNTITSSSGVRLGRIASQATRTNWKVRMRSFKAMLNKNRFGERDACTTILHLDDPVKDSMFGLSWFLKPGNVTRAFNYLSAKYFMLKLADSLMTYSVTKYFNCCGILA